jgi:hypothetical protein
MTKTEFDARLLNCEPFCLSCGAELEPRDIVWTDAAGNAFCCQRCGMDFERTGRAVEPIVAERAADARPSELVGASIRKRQGQMFL